jgi:peptidoglycan/LPS O-acetylase OafA/YrhL
MTKDSAIARLDDFVLGMAICRWYVTDRLPAGGRAVACIAVGFVLVLLSSVGWDNVMVSRVPFVVAAFLHDFTNIGMGLVLMGFLGAPRRLRSLVSVRPLQLAGMMCYSLYVWHMFGVDFRGPKWEHPAYAILLIVLVSALTYRYIEFPSRSVRKLFLEYPS